MNGIKLLSRILPRFTMGKVARQRRMGRGVCVIFIIMFILEVIPFLLHAEDKNKPVMNIQLGSSFAIDSVSITSDGKYALSGSGGISKLWNVASGKEIRIFNGHSNWRNSVTFSNDGKYALSSSVNLKLWEVATGREIKEFVGNSSMINFSVFSKDDKYILSALTDHTLKLWDVVSGKEIRTFIGHTGSVNSVAFSNDGKYALSGSFDNSLKLWDIATGRVKKTFIGHKFTVTSVAFSPDGTSAVSGSYDSTLKIWNLSSGKNIKTFSLKAAVNAVLFSPDGNYLISGSLNNSVQIWDRTSGKLVKTFSGHSEEVTSISISTDGKYILSGSKDKSIKLWDVKNGIDLKKISNEVGVVRSVTLKSDGMNFMSSSSNGLINIWDGASGRVIKTINEVSGYFRVIILSPDGRYVLSFSDDKVLKLRNITNDSDIKYFDHNSSWILSAAFSPNGNNFVTGSVDGILKLWDIESGRCLRTFSSPQSVRLPSDAINSIVFSADGKYILSGSSGYGLTTVLWDVETGEMVKFFEVHKPVNSVAFSPNGNEIITGCDDGTIEICDFLSGKVIKTFTGLFGSINTVSFSPDGKKVLSGSTDNSIKLWDLASGEEFKTFLGHSHSVNSVSFYPDSKYIISGSWDKTTRIWNISTGAWVAFMSHSNGKDWLIFDSDGYWDASRYGGDLVAMVKGMDCWNIDQFAIKNNRPDLILAKLPNADKELISEYNLQYKKRIAKLEKLYGIKESDLGSDMHVPKAEILKAEQSGKNMSLSIKLTDSEYNIVSYNVFVNDVPVYTEIGKKIKRNDELSVTENIELTPGENKIEVSCFNEKGAESYRALTLASYGGKHKGSLYYIGFGVADYEDTTINDLKYSENDVTDLANKFSSMKNEYNRINIKTYTGKEVTAANIKAAKDFVKNATVDDTVILFISGHGIHDSDEFKTYYYLTQNTDMKNLKGTAADFETVEDILAGINPRKKLFLMDTCDSGELDDFAGKQMITYNSKGNKGIPRTPKGIVVDAGDKRGYFDRSRYIYNDLFRRTGAVVFSSSKGGEVSWEYDSLKNGAFTEAMLDGLSGKADKDKNGAVSIDELQEFVSKGVINYTDDRQHPVIDRDNIYVKIELPVR